MKANKRVRDLARRAKNLFKRPKTAEKPITEVPIAKIVVDEPVVPRTPAEELEYLFATYNKKKEVK